MSTAAGRIMGKPSVRFEEEAFGKSCRQLGSQIRALFEWPRTLDEDINESPGALPPVGAARYIGDTDKRPKWIEWIEVCPYVAALNCTLHKCVNRTGDLSARSFIHL
jgi:hypothetical protein